VRAVLATAACLLVTAPARAQPAGPAACDACARGEALIAQLDLGDVRALGDIELAEPITREQYARIVAMRTRHPRLAGTVALRDAQLAYVAMAVGAGREPCATRTGHALRCLADRCAVALPLPPAEVLGELREECVVRGRSTRRTVPIGVGLEWGNGVQESAYPTDGRAWSVGIEARVRATNRWSAVARFDWMSSRDAAEDADNDGNDDASTGSITRIAALAGPSIVLDRKRMEGTQRYLRVDLLGGYVATRSQPDEKGVAAGADVAYHAGAFRLGVRYLHGFGDASDASAVLGHAGFVVGGTPQMRPEGCGGPARARTRLALGFDLPLVGVGLDSQLGYLATGLAFELLYRLHRRFDLVARGDVLYFPGYGRDRVVHTGALAGVRVDHGPYSGSSWSRTGFSTVLFGGYSHGAALVGSTGGSGPVVEVAPGWGIRTRDGGGGTLRLHARFGLGEDNRDLIAVFLSAGFDINLGLRDRD